MIILMPMGGLGTRFSSKGYQLNKAEILTTFRKTVEKLPMVICALKDIPGSDTLKNKIICINRLEHKESGLEQKILDSFPQAIFIHDHVQLDQAYGCFLAREFLDSEEELFVGACDNGFDIDINQFNKLKKEFDAIMISHSNDSNIESNPNAHSWAKLDKDKKTLLDISFKKIVSNDFMKDHATTGMFWFKSAKTFLKYLEKMIWKKDTHQGKFYVDKLLKYYITDKKKVTFFDVKYLCWGTPEDYENYENTISYWSNFLKQNKWIKTKK